MSHSLAKSTLPLTLLAIGGCFDPLLGQDSADGGSSDGSTSSLDTTDPGTTTDPTTEGHADSTGPVDAPPTITAFTVNDSTMPAELQNAGMVAFDVDAMDDMGIDHVEIYDGDTLVTSTTEIPYVTQLLLTSADNGSHSYSAVVYDTAGQTVESEVVPLSVNVVGGEMLVIREDIADFRMSFFVGSAPRVVIDPWDEVTVVSAFREDVIDDAKFGITAISYSDTLSLLWTDTRLPLDISLHRTYMNIGKPAYDAASSSWWTGAAMFGEIELDRAVAIVDTAAEAITTLQPFGSADDFVASPVAVDSRGSILLSTTLGQLQKQPTLDDVPIWTVPVGNGEAFFTDILVASDDTIIVVSLEEGCAPTSDRCVYKLSSNGDVLWSRPAPAVSSSSAVSASISPLGHVALAGSVDGPVQLIVLDENGDTITDQPLMEDSIYEARDIVYDAQGSLVIAGDLRLDSDDYQREAWAGRFDEQGNTIWFHVYELEADHGATGLATNPGGELFAVGWADSFELDIVGWSGRGWVASLSL